MGDSQNSGGYQYWFGEADAITRKIEEYHKNHDNRTDDIPVPLSPEHSSENILPVINNNQLQSQPNMSMTFNPISLEHSSSQDNSHITYQREFQNQRTMPNPRQRQCWKCLISMFISWLVRLFVPRPRSRPIPMPSNASPDLISEQFRGQPNQDSLDEVIQGTQEHERVNIGEGLTERQFSQLPTIKFQPSLEDKKCMICQSDYTRGDEMTILPCTHKYHKDCIRPWLHKSKLCCICQREVFV